MIAIDQQGPGTLAPREPRTSVRLKATLWSDRLEPREIEIRNLSRRGVGVRCRFERPLTGERVTIHVAEFPSMNGTVRWCRGDQFGILLDVEIDPEALAVTQTELPPKPGIDLDF